ncbi:MAG: hypothetical protein KAY24_04160 [Candidatus Eisenbacteria sp.]|nr:hypothetical protein [Candidatus Eisenbacteria bacterium]
MIVRSYTLPVWVIGVCLLFTGCTTAPKLTTMQIRQLTVRQVEGSYENTYRATMTVLQDNGYVIKNTDMDSGLIVGTIDKEASGGSQFMQALFSGHVADKGRVYEASCMVGKLSDSASEVRINIQETTYGESSAFSGTSKQKARQIYDPEIYAALFNAITVEVKRREAINPD